MRHLLSSLLVLLWSVGFAISDTTLCTSSLSEWKETSKPAVTLAHRAVAVAGSKLYLLGGTSALGVQSPRVDVYDAVIDVWTVGKPLPQRISHAQAVSDGQFVWLAGGYESLTPDVPSVAVWRYDIADDKWLELTSLPELRDAGALGFTDRSLFYVGGRDSWLRDQSDVWMLDVDDVTASWRTLEDTRPVVPRAWFGLATANGVLYAVGGEQRVGSRRRMTATVDAYTFPDGWQRRSDLPSARAYTAASTLVINGNVAVFGGRNSSGATNSALQYAPGVDRWLPLPDLPLPLQSPAVGFLSNVVVDSFGRDHVLLASGITASGTINERVWISLVSTRCEFIRIPPPPEPDKPAAVVPTGVPVDPSSRIDNLVGSSAGHRDAPSRWLSLAAVVGSLLLAAAGCCGS